MAERLSLLEVLEYVAQQPDGNELLSDHGREVLQRERAKAKRSHDGASWDLCIIEALARAACSFRGRDPDKYPDLPPGPYGNPLPWFAPDGYPKPWHEHVEFATTFLAMWRCVEVT
jgi:hypothetical protein